MPAFETLSPILRRAGQRLVFRCPGCDIWHIVSVDSPDSPNWSWNGNVEQPTFQPSILVRTGRAVHPGFVREEGDPPEICHSYVTDGRIQFLPDSTHALAGRTVDIPLFDRDAE
jgi:hypothetical protein